MPTFLTKQLLPFSGLLKTWKSELFADVQSFLCLNYFAILDDIADESFVNGEEAGGEY